MALTYARHSIRIAVPMKRQHIYLPVLLILSGALCITGQDHVHPHDDTIPPKIFKADKSSRVTFGSEIAFGKEILPKGRYVVEHRMEGNDHWIVFTPFPKGKRVEVQARTSPASDPVNRIEILAFPDSKRFEIVRIHIPGENVDHLF
jgi:hypothetical protein